MPEYPVQRSYRCQNNRNWRGTYDIQLNMIAAAIMAPPEGQEK